MAKLAAFQRDTKAITDGAWIVPDPRNHPDIALLVKGKDVGFYDALSARQREAVRRAREDGVLTPRQGFDDLPISARLAIDNRLLLERQVLGVRGLDGEDGPVQIEAYREMAMTEEFRPLLDLAIEAVEIATHRRMADKQAAEGNFAPSPRTASPGVAPQS